MYLEGRGGKFAGPSTRRIMTDPLLSNLKRLLPDTIASLVHDYLAALWALHGVCMAEHLTPDWPDYIARFKELFLQLYHHPDLASNEKKVHMTYKVHNLVNHLGAWFR